MDGPWWWQVILLLIPITLLIQSLMTFRRRRRFRDPRTRDAEIDRVIDALSDSVMGFGEVARDLDAQREEARKAREELTYLKELVAQTEPEASAFRWALRGELQRGWKQSVGIGLATNFVVGLVFFIIGRLTA